ncbi:hypothetical protein QAD02_022931 [Eretmocerus hayati]|uniref:Uncharacterized protein n=1 Tax=Eretmocerus hayati TaxID=131215 RepID=A0ACC2PUQ9_9HYME|nr:hypothetical protein QAD02_022931 [Eretmocerus hayati]
MSSAPWTHIRRVKTLYKVVLRLHRGLPAEVKELGDLYVKDEFRRHKNCTPDEANVFLNEWADYAIGLSEQLGLRGPRSAKPLGKPLDLSDLDNMRDEQVQQLYELMKAVQNPEDSKSAEHSDPKNDLR